jgi:organic hydroperoxide reductase OsmC/OhrA
LSENFTIRLARRANYRFEVHFDNPAFPNLLTDEAAPLGGDSGPNPSRLLVTAVAHCVSASLPFAMRKLKNEPEPIRTAAGLARSERNRLRIASIAIDLHHGIAAESIHMAERILAQFEHSCVTPRSTRPAIPVTVRVFDKGDKALKE